MKHYKLTIPGLLPGLNEYVDAERGAKGKYKAAAMKKQAENVIGYMIKTQLRVVRFTRPVVKHNTWIDPKRQRDKENIDFSKKIASVKSDIAALTAKVGSVDYLMADDTGYYVSSADGYENTLSFSNIKNLSSDKIKAALSASPAAVPANTKGKLIHGYTWYFVGIVNKSDATRLNDGDSVTLRCDNMSRDSINASVYYRGPINTDETVLILSSKIMDSDIARLRTEDVEIVINETDGIRVNKSAVRVIDGVQGVYVLTGNIVRFKKLDIIYTGEDYVISKMIKEDVYDENKVPYLKIYDAVILEGKDLKDGKLIGY